MSGFSETILRRDPDRRRDEPLAVRLEPAAFEVGRFCDLRLPGSDVVCFTAAIDRVQQRLARPKQLQGRETVPLVQVVGLGV